MWEKKNQKKKKKLVTFFVFFSFFLLCFIEEMSRVYVLSQSQYTVIAMLWSCVMARDVWYPCVVSSWLINLVEILVWVTLFTVLAVIARHYSLQTPLPSHWCSYIADHLHILCYNWNASWVSTEGGRPGISPLHNQFSTPQNSQRVILVIMTEADGGPKLPKNFLGEHTPRPPLGVLYFAHCITYDRLFPPSNKNPVWNPGIPGTQSLRNTRSQDNNFMAIAYHSV